MADIPSIKISLLTQLWHKLQFFDKNKFVIRNQISAFTSINKKKISVLGKIYFLLKRRQNLILKNKWIDARVIHRYFLL